MQNHLIGLTILAGKVIGNPDSVIALAPQHLDPELLLILDWQQLHNEFLTPQSGNGSFPLR